MNESRPGRTLHRRSAATCCAGAFVMTLLALAGCSKDKATEPKPIVVQSTPADVVRSFQLCYSQRKAAEYAELLADDFTFYFDPYSKDIHGSPLPVSWNRTQDSTGTGKLFAATDVSDIRLVLIYQTDVPDTARGHAGWRKIRISDTNLDVDQVAPVGELITW